MASKQTGAKAPKQPKNTTLSNPDAFRPLEEAAKFFSDARDELGREVAKLEAEVQVIRDRYRNSIRALAGRAAEARDVLKARVTATPELFDTPRSRTLWGIKFGWQKQPGKVVFDNAEAVCKRIDELMPDKVDTLIKVSREPRKDMLKELSGSDLLALGVSLVDATDHPYVNVPDNEIDKLIAALGGSDEVVP